MRARSTVAAIAVAMMVPSAAGAAEVKVLSSNAVKTVLEQLAPQFEKATETKIAFTFGTAAGLKAEIEKGAAFDVAILTAPGIDDLIKQGKVAGSRTDMAGSGIGVAVRKGAPKPDISTTEAFKHALIGASSIGYVEQGASGIYLKGLIDRFGLTAGLRPKTKLLPASNPAAQAVANGEVEIGMTMISEILPYAGAELVGPLPPEIQSITMFSLGAAAAAKEPEAAKALIKFFTSPEAATVIKAKGLEPAH